MSATTTLRAIAYKSGWTTSAEATASTVTITVAAPTFSVVTGTYNANQTVTLSTASAGASIRYTTDGSAPSSTSGFLYGAPITVSSTQQVRAIAYKTSFGNTSSSGITQETYTLQAAVPVISPVTGSYGVDQTVTITTATTGATIYFTTTGVAATTSDNVYSGPFSVSANTTINAIAAKTGWNSSGNAAASVISITVAAPTFSVVTGTYNTDQTVTLSTTSAGASIRYTTDGSAPSSTAGFLYGAPITVSSTQQVRAIAYKTSFGNTSSSGITQETYTLQGTTPVISPATGSYAVNQNVTITTATPGATIYYTTTGVAATTSDNIYSGPFTVSATTTINAIATRTGWSISANATASVISITVANPTFSVATGTYNANQSVTLSTASVGATIKYTTDGSAPSSTNGIVYGEPVIIDKTTTLKAIAYKTSFGNVSSSLVMTEIYTLQVAAPVITPATNSFAADQTATITAATSDATIYYTTNNSVPDNTKNIYTGPFTVSATTTLRAIAYKTGWSTSAEATSSTISITVANPTFSVATGTFNVNQSVTLSTTAAGATIRYTTDGSVPSSTSGSVYGGPVTIDRTATLMAIAYKTCFGNTSSSAVMSETYTLQVVAPVISPATNTFATDQLTSISTTTADATIYYTTDGSAPDNTKNIYSGPFTVSATTTLRSIAYKTNWSISAEATSSTISITVADPTISPAGGTYSTNQTLTISTTSAGATIRYTTDGVTTPTATVGTIYTGPFTVDKTTTVRAMAYKTYAANTSSSPSAFIQNIYTLQGATPAITPVTGSYAVDQNVSISSATPGVTIYYTTNGVAATTSDYVYSGPFTVSATTTINAIAAKTGWTTSANATASLITITVADPTITPGTGTYTSNQTVSISTTSAGAAIRYTTDGSIPSASVGTIYTGSITVTATTAVRAIAYKTCFGNTSSSNVVLATLTLNQALTSIDVTNDVGEDTSIKVVADRAADGVDIYISYYDLGNGYLKLAKSTDGGTTWTRKIVDNGGGTNDVGSFSSITVNQGASASLDKIYISYYDATAGDLKLAYSADGGSTWTKAAVDSANNVGQYTSIALDSGGLICISYYDVTNGALLFIKSTDTAGTTWGGVQIVDTATSADVGRYSSIAIDTAASNLNFIAICYYDAINGQLLFIRSTNTTGTTWGTVEVVDTATSVNVGQYISMKLDSADLVCISYYDAVNQNLMFRKSNQANPTLPGHWDAIQTVESSNDVGQYSSLSLDAANLIYISFYDATNGNLRFIQSTNAAGTLWNPAIAIDSTGNVGLFTSIGMSGTNVVISYYDLTNTHLKSAKSADGGTTW